MSESAGELEPFPVLISLVTASKLGRAIDEDGLEWSQVVTWRYIKQVQEIIKEVRYLLDHDLMKLTILVTTSTTWLIFSTEPAYL